MALSPRRIGRLAARLAPSFIGSAVLWGLLSGAYDSLAELGRWQGLSLAALAVGICVLSLGKVRRQAQERSVSLVEEAELGALLLLATYAVTQPLGGPISPLRPLTYLVMAFIAGFLPLPVGVALLGLAMALEAGLFAAGGMLSSHLPILIAHLVFLTLFAILSYLVYAWLVATERATGRLALQEQRRRQAEEVRLHRLRDIEAEDFDEERWIQASVSEVKEAVSNALDLAHHALRPHSVAAYLLQEEEGQVLRLHGFRSAADDLRRAPFAAKQGLLAAALQRGSPMRLCGAIKGVTWYEKGKDIQSVIIVPIVDHRRVWNGSEEEARLRGLLIADRSEALAFTEADENLLQVTGREVLRALEIERVMGHISRAREEKVRFHQWTERFNAASKVGEVIETTLAVAGEAMRSTLSESAPDFLAVTTCSYDEGEGRRLHRIEGIGGERGSAAKAWMGAEFEDQRSLVAQVVQHKATLPERELEAMDRLQVFGEDLQLRGLGALKIVPLRLGEEVLGTLVCGSRKRGGIGVEVVRLLEFIGLQAAQSLHRARLFEQTERLATTDGLTGLLNHRVFQGRLEDEIGRARRSGSEVSLIVCDIDHFKTVNDTYGHATGDEVLKGVARIIQREARATDVVARIGGEEFALILPETEMRGGKATAERIREAVMAHAFVTDLGPLRCTLSLGIASFPRAAKDKKSLFEVADECLYLCKRGGRNRSMTWEEMKAARQEGEQASG